jgi:hypothetical protein
VIFFLRITHCRPVTTGGAFGLSDSPVKIDAGAENEPDRRAAWISHFFPWYKRREWKVRAGNVCFGPLPLEADLPDLVYVEQSLFLPSGKERMEAFLKDERLRRILPEVKFR